MFLISAVESSRAFLLLVFSDFVSVVVTEDTALEFSLCPNVKFGTCSTCAWTEHLLWLLGLNMKSFE